MEELLKLAIASAMDEAMKKSKTPKTSSKLEIDVESIKEVAKINKNLFDAHIEVGFTPEQAIQLVTTIINN